MIKYLWRRRTTAWGYVVVFLGVLAVSDGVIPPKAMKWIILANGLIQAGLGHYNNSQLKRAADNTLPPPAAGAGRMMGVLILALLAGVLAMA